MLCLFNQLRAFTDSRDDLSLGHVVVLLQLDWPQGEILFLKAVDKICQQGSFQYENFFNYVTSILICNCKQYDRTDKIQVCIYSLSSVFFSVMSGMFVSLKLLISLRHRHAGGVCLLTDSRRRENSAGAAS